MKIKIAENGTVTLTAENSTDSHSLTHVVKKLAKGYSEQKNNIKPKM